MFCIYLRTNSDLYHLQHHLIGFYNRDEKCLLCGTDWVFKWSGLRFVFKGLIILTVFGWTSGRSATLRAERRLKVSENLVLRLRGRKWQEVGRNCITRSVIFCNIQQIGLSNQEGWDVLGMLYVWRREMHAGFWWGKQKEEDSLEDIIVDGRIIFVWIVKK